MSNDTGILLYARNTSSGRFVCFNCRVCFHKAGYKENPKTFPLFPCNNCKGSLLYAGNAFRAPRRTDKATWAVLEVLIRSGHRFNHNGSGIIPKTLSETKKLLDCNKNLRAARLTTGKRVMVKYKEGNSYLLP